MWDNHKHHNAHCGPARRFCQLHGSLRHPSCAAVKLPLLNWSNERESLRELQKRRKSSPLLLLLLLGLGLRGKWLRADVWLLDKGFAESADALELRGRAKHLLPAKRAQKRAADAQNVARHRKRAAVVFKGVQKHTRRRIRDEKNVHRAPVGHMPRRKALQRDDLDSCAANAWPQLGKAQNRGH